MLDWLTPILLANSWSLIASVLFSERMLATASSAPWVGLAGRPRVVDNIGFRLAKIHAIMQKS
jgi:hypothetical protein